MTSRPITPSTPVDFIRSGLFDNGADYGAYRPTGTNDFLLILTLAGIGRFGVFDQSELLAPAGVITLIRPGVLHDYATSGRRWRLIWCHFRPLQHWHELLTWADERRPTVLKLGRRFAAISRTFSALHRHALLPGPLAKRRALNQLESLLIDLAELHPHGLEGQIDSRIRAVMDHIATHLKQQHTLDSLAELASLSVGRFGHLFTQATGMSPIAFVEQQRLHRAAQLLSLTSMNIKQISHEVGFDSPFYFSRRFSKQFRQSPTEYREARSPV